MRWVKDRTGRFPERPHYTQEELDRDCEDIAISVLKKRHDGAILFPIPTDDLTVMIEDAGADLDSSTDLSGYGPTVDGLTEFALGEKPVVRISSRIADNPRYENRLRTTLTHECGHLRHHRYLLETKAMLRDLFDEDKVQRQSCKRETIENARQTDWMEWQAGYCCGAILMPYSYVRETMNSYMLRHGTGPFPLLAGAPEGEALVGLIAAEYGVSYEAARVRLTMLGALADEIAFNRPLYG